MQASHQPQGATRIWLFGDLLIQQESGAIFSGRRGFLSLLAYLLLCGSQPVSRQAVALALWPGQPSELARANLRKGLFRLRQSLPDVFSALRVTTAYLSWQPQPSLWVDVWEFDRCLGEGSTAKDWQAAVSLYRGDLLAHWNDEWLRRARRTYRDRYLATLRRLIDTAMNQGRVQEALPYAEALYRADPLSEDSLRRLVTAYASSGDLARSREHYTRGLTRIRQEVGPGLAPETRALAAWLQRSTGSPAPPPFPGSPSVPKVFVGRDHQLAVFRDWLADSPPAPPILVIHGPGGIGKTTLLHRLYREATALGHPVRMLDAREFQGSEELLRAHLGSGSWDAILETLNEQRPLIFLDHAEALDPLCAFWRDHLLPALSPAVRWVVAGRLNPSSVFALLGSHRTRPLRLLSLHPFSPAESRVFLHAHGLSDPALAPRLIGLTGGNPLALSLAAELVAASGLRAWGAIPPIWRLITHELVTYLLRDQDPNLDPTLLPVLEVAAVVRHCHEPLFAALLPEVSAPLAFRRLAALPFVRPTPWGLTLSDDVRTLLSHDLRWRNPLHWSRLCEAARAYWLNILNQPLDPANRAHAIEEVLYLTSHPVFHDLLFPPGDPDAFHVTAPTPFHVPLLRALWASWLARHFPPHWAAQEQAALAQAMAHPALQWRVVFDRSDSPHGFLGILPVCHDTLPLLKQSHHTAAFLNARYPSAERASLPPHPGQATTWWIRFWACAPFSPEATRALLLREVIALLAVPRHYVVTAALPSHKQVLEALGFVPVPGARWTAPGMSTPYDSYELDLTHPSRPIASWARALVDRLTARQEEMSS